MKLILVRHGQSENNLARMSEGNSCLSELGREQVGRVAEVLRDEKIDIIYSSDLVRARETAEAICERLGKEIVFDSRLREQSYGVFEGKSWDEVIESTKGLDVSEFERVFEGGESYGDVIKRVGEFFEEIRCKHEGESVVIVAHGVVIRCLLCYLFGESVNESRKYKHGNTGISFLEYVCGEWKIEKLNCTEHLE